MCCLKILCIIGNVLFMNRWLNRVKNIGADFGLNLLATLITVGSMQLIVYPTIASTTDAESYGVFLTMIAIVGTVSGMLGNGLNNLRLIVNSEYDGNEIGGDFNILLLFSVLLGFWGSMLSLVYFGFPFSFSFFVCGIVILQILRGYLTVAFRLIINYKKTLNISIIFALMCIVACVVYKSLLKDYISWPVLFLFPEIPVLVYLWFNTSLLKESFSKTKHFGSLFFKYLNIMYVNLISSIKVYFDRALLLPLLGGEAVSAYFAATFLGKGFILFIAPLSNVLLSYYGQKDFILTRRIFWLGNITTLMMAIVGYFLVLILSGPLVNFFYPSLYNSAKEYFWIADMIPFFHIVNDIIRPAAIKYVPLDVISKYNTCLLVATGVTCYYAISWFGLFGFCTNLIILEGIQIGFQCALTHYYLGRYKL